MKTIRLKRVLSLSTFILGILALYMMFIYAPTEKSMGDIQRIMYPHVASAWIAYLSFGIVGLSSIIFLWKRTIIWDNIAQASAELGVLFATILLITGSIWGYSVWNAWWVWDPRLTSTLILWFVYIGYLLLRKSPMEQTYKRLVTAVYGIISVINIPLVHYSVKWWRSIHPYTITHTEIKMPMEMFQALIVSSVFFLALYLLFMIYRTKLIAYTEHVYTIKEELSKYKR